MALDIATKLAGMPSRFGLVAGARIHELLVDRGRDPRHRLGGLHAQDVPPRVHGPARFPRLHCSNR